VKTAPWRSRLGKGARQQGVAPGQRMASIGISDFLEGLAPGARFPNPLYPSPAGPGSLRRLWEVWLLSGREKSGGELRFHLLRKLIDVSKWPTT